MNTKNYFEMNLILRKKKPNILVGHRMKLRMKGLL